MCAIAQELATLEEHDTRKDQDVERCRSIYHRGMTDLDQRTVRAIARAMPKAELHLHLDGSLRIDTALDIARTRGIDAPTTFAGMRGVLVGPDQSTDQAELLKAFDLPIALMQDAEAIERISADLVEDKARDNVRYVEVRWAPLLHTAKGLTGRQVVDATANGARLAAQAAGIDARLIATLMRSHEPEANLAFVRDLEANGIPDGLVARRPRRARAALPRPDHPPRGHRPRARDRAPRHRPRRRVGRRRAGPPDARDRPGAHRPRAPRHRRPGPRRRAHPPRDLARPVPHLERPGADRADPRGPPAARACCAPACG